jgi:multiple sugar transport system substrate-binding protein
MQVWLVLWLVLALAACGVADSTPQASAEIEEVTAIAGPAGSTPSPRPSRTPVSPAILTASPPPIIDIPAASLQGLTIHFWHPYAGEAQVLLDLITREFNTSNRWGIQVVNTPISGFTLLEQRLRQAAQDQSLPDMWTMSTYQALQIDANGTVVADLNPYIEDPTYGLTADEQEDFLPALWQQDLVPPPALKGRAPPEGKRLGLVWTRSAVLLVYNQTWAHELGFDRPPETPPEFRRQVCAAARANNRDSDQQNDGSGGWMLTGDPSELLGWLLAYGAQISREDGRGYQFDTPEARQAIAFLHGLSQDGCAWLNAGVDPRAALSERQALVAVVPLGDLTNQREDAVASGVAGAGPLSTATPGRRLATGTSPAPTATMPLATVTATTKPDDVWLPLPFPGSDGSPVVVSYGPSLVVGRSQAVRELAAWLFVRWLTAPENQARWVQFTHSLPARRSALEGIQASQLDEPAWETSLSYWDSLQAEPYYVSWGVLRWALGDAVAQLFQPDLTDEQATSILKLLDELAVEVHLQVR